VARAQPPTSLATQGVSEAHVGEHCPIQQARAGKRRRRVTAPGVQSSAPVTVPTGRAIEDIPHTWPREVRVTSTDGLPACAHQADGRQGWVGIDIAEPARPHVQTPSKGSTPVQSRAWRRCATPQSSEAAQRRAPSPTPSAASRTGWNRAGCPPSSPAARRPAAPRRRHRRAREAVGRRCQARAAGKGQRSHAAKKGHTGGAAAASARARARQAAAGGGGQRGCRDRRPQARTSASPQAPRAGGVPAVAGGGRATASDGGRVDTLRAPRRSRGGRRDGWPSPTRGRPRAERPAAAHYQEPMGGGRRPQGGGGGIRTDGGQRVCGQLGVGVCQCRPGCGSEGGTPDPAKGAGHGKAPGLCSFQSCESRCRRQSWRYGQCYGWRRDRTQAVLQQKTKEKKAQSGVCLIRGSNGKKDLPRFLTRSSRVGHPATLIESWREPRRNKGTKAATN